MIGTIIKAEVRESRARKNTSYLVIEFMDDYEHRHFLYISPLAEQHFKQFCDMTRWDYNSFLAELTGRIISVDNKPEWFQGRTFTRWFIRSDWREQ